MEAELGGIMTTEEAAEAVGVNAHVLMQAARQGRVRFTRRRSGRSGLWDTGRLQFLLRDVQEWFDEYKPDCHGITQKRILGTPCANCKATVEIFAKFLCKNCYNYERRTGRPRPLPKTDAQIAEGLANMPARPCNARDRVVTDNATGEEWVSQSEAADMLGIGRERVRQLVKEGKFRDCRRFGNDKAPRIRKADVEARRSRS